MLLSNWSAGRPDSADTLSLIHVIVAPALPVLGAETVNANWCDWMTDGVVLSRLSRLQTIERNQAL
jgi:hypothetical protein